MVSSCGYRLGAYPGRDLLPRQRREAAFHAKIAGFQQGRVASIDQRLC